MNKLCHNNCNKCQILHSTEYRHLTKIFNELYEKLGEKVYEIIQRNCPNFTACANCGIDDFCHVSGCEIIEAIDDNQK